MAEGKKSFQLYAEWIEVFEALDDADAGQLIKHIFQYVNDKNPETENPMVKLGFIQMKQQLKRDLKKWETKCAINRANGVLGGRPKNPKEPKITERLINYPKEPDKVEDKVKDKVKVEDINNLKIKLFKPDFELFISDCFKYLGKAYTKGNPSSKGIESNIRKWLLRNDPNMQVRNLGAYVKVTPDRKFRAKTIERLLEKLEGYNFCQDLVSYQAPNRMSTKF